MRLSWIYLFAVGGLLATTPFRFDAVRSAPALLDPAFATKAGAQVRPGTSSSGSPLRAARSSPADLELGGDLEGVPSGSTRYITRNDLLALSQVSYGVSDDRNFTGLTQISGVPLEELMRHLGAAPTSDMVIAICDDQYRAHYSRAYIEDHHPLLVLKINGQDPPGWPKEAEGHSQDMGPFLISHPAFRPSFEILAYREEAQIPWGVVRIEFRDGKAEFGAIAPRGAHAADRIVQDGYRIAQQNCFRCHNMGQAGGTKAGHPWLVLSAWAAASPKYFADYVRNPQSRNPRAQMPGNPSYDDATIGALIAYFRTFSSSTAATSTREQSHREKP
jgi:mono/diheme cytochrome c family protein